MQHRRTTNESSNMTSITLSQNRVEQVNSIVNRFTSSFEKVIGEDITADDFTSIFHPDIQWLDHAFLIQRVGQTAVMGLQKSFTYCNQPFRSEMKVGSANRSIRCEADRKEHHSYRGRSRDGVRLDWTLCERYRETEWRLGIQSVRERLQVSRLYVFADHGRRTDQTNR